MLGRVGVEDVEGRELGRVRVAIGCFTSLLW